MLAGRGAFLYMQSAYAEAEALLDDALTLEPSNALWHCARANVRFDSGRVRGAEADLARALELDRRCAPAYLQQAPTILTRLVLVVRCPRAQTADCCCGGSDAGTWRSSTATNPPRPRKPHDCCPPSDCARPLDVIVMSQRRSCAVRELRHSLAIDDSLPLAHVELALALQATGKVDQALYVLDKAAERFPSSIELRCFHAEMVG